MTALYETNIVLVLGFRSGELLSFGFEFLFHFHLPLPSKLSTPAPSTSPWLIQNPYKQATSQGDQAVSSTHINEASGSEDEGSCY